MKQDAEVHAEEDKKKKELIEAKNLGEQLIYTAEKSLKDHADKVPAETKTDIEGKIEELKKMKDSTDVATIKTATEALSSSLSKIGEIIAKATQEQTKSAENQKNDDKKDDGDVRDAETK